MPDRKTLLTRTSLALTACTAAAVAALALSSTPHALQAAAVAAAPTAAPSSPVLDPAPTTPAAAPTSPAPAAPATSPAPVGPAPNSSRASPPPSTAVTSAVVVVGALAAGTLTAAQTPPKPLTATDLPDNGAALWKPIGPARLQAVDHDVRLNECAAVHGAAIWQQQGYVSTFKTPAIEDSFTFPDEAGAQAAQRSLVAGMDTCQAQSRTLQNGAGKPADAQVARTATTIRGAAYTRQWTAVAGLSAPGPQTNHIYLVQHANVLTALQFTEMPGAGSAHTVSTTEDAATLTILTDRQ